MNCPNCQKGSIPFARVWLTGEFRTQQCPECGAVSHYTSPRSMLPITLRVLSSGLAALAVVLGFRFLSGLVFAIILVFSLVVNAFIVLWFGRLELYAPRPHMRT